MAVCDWGAGENLRNSPEILHGIGHGRQRGRGRGRICTQWGVCIGR